MILDLKLEDCSPCWNDSLYTTPSFYGDIVTRGFATWLDPCRINAAASSGSLKRGLNQPCYDAIWTENHDMGLSKNGYLSMYIYIYISLSLLIAGHHVNGESEALNHWILG